MADPETSHHLRRVHGRRIGRPLNALRRGALETGLPEIAIADHLLTERGDMNPTALFERIFSSCWMEIGFGNGEHLAALVRQYPDTAFLGAEPFTNGMAAFLKDIQDARPDNVRVLMEDAMKIVHSLKDNSLDRLYILNPDPWPKKRHHKRRIVHRRNLDAFSRVLKPGSLLIMASDVADLSDWMRDHAAAHPDFEQDAGNAKDPSRMPDDWILTTRYAQKGMDAGRQEIYLIFENKKTGHVHETL